MTDVKLALRGLRGESFADIARRTGEIVGEPVAPDASDQDVIDAFAEEVASDAADAAAAAATIAAANAAASAALSEAAAAASAATAASEVDAVLSTYPAFEVDTSGAVPYVTFEDGHGFKWPITMGKPKTTYFAFIGDSIAQGYGNSIGDPSPTTMAYEMASGPTIVYPLADPVGGAIGGSMMPAWANEWTAQTGKRAAIEELGTGSSYLLAAGSAGNNWSSTGALRAAAATRINASLAALASSPDHNRTDAKTYIVLMLGTNDAAAVNGTTITGALFATELAGLFAYYKAQITGLTGFLVYQIGDDSDASPAGINDKYREIRAAIATAVAAEPTARIVSRAFRSFAYDAKRLLWDQVHPNQTGCNLLGKLGAREASKATATVPAAPVLLASTLYEDTNTATASTATVSHTPQAGCKAILVVVSGMRNTAATGITISGATFDGAAMTLLNGEISQTSAAGTSSAIRSAAFLMNANFAAVAKNIVATLSAVTQNISIAVFEFDRPVVQEAGFAKQLSTSNTVIDRTVYSALPSIACVAVASVATSGSALTHTFTGATKVDEGGQTDATNASQMAIATAPVAENTAVAIQATLSAAFRAAVIYAVLMRAAEDGEL